MAATRRINSKSITRRARVAFVLTAASVGLSIACAPAVNPFYVDLQPTQRVTTASVEGVEAYEGTATSLTRSSAPTTVSAESGAVQHVTLYYEDPPVEEGGEEGSKAWTAEDYFDFLPLAPGRFLLNTITWPIQAVMDPPWTVHVSDGSFGRQSWDGRHDAEPDSG